MRAVDGRGGRRGADAPAGSRRRETMFNTITSRVPRTSVMADVRCRCQTARRRAENCGGDSEGVFAGFGLSLFAFRGVAERNFGALRGPKSPFKSIRDVVTPTIPLRRKAQRCFVSPFSCIISKRCLLMTKKHHFRQSEEISSRRPGGLKAPKPRQARALLAREWPTWGGAAVSGDSPFGWDSP